MEETRVRPSSVAPPIPRTLLRPSSHKIAASRKKTKETERVNKWPKTDRPTDQREEAVPSGNCSTILYLGRNSTQ